MNSESLPTASPPKAANDTEVLSRRIPGQGETVLEVPQGDILDVGRMRGKTPMDSDDGDHSKFGPQPDTVPEPPMVPDSGRQPLAIEGKPPVPKTSIHPEASDNLQEVLRGASIDEEHHTLMSTVSEKVRSAKSGLAEAYANLLTCFEVSNQIIRKYHSIDSSP